jgi:hypothetical protein
MFCSEAANIFDKKTQNLNNWVLIEEWSQKLFAFAISCKLSSY